YIIIGCAALTTMFSTTLTTLDASPRSMAKTVELLFKNTSKHLYLSWLSVLVIGSILIFFFLNSELGFLVQVATVLSFLTAPFYALSNYILLSSKHTPKAWQPSIKMHILSVLGITFLILFSIWYLTTL
ncbi:MAG: divalent metal cation transporter, partial [Bacteroidia bacterium]|nr:divalent metal cation transporter [Bacteroidia bacterium]